MGKAAHPAAKGPLYYFGDVHSIPFLVSNLAPFFSFFFYFFHMSRLTRQHGHQLEHGLIFVFVTGS